VYELHVFPHKEDRMNPQDVCCPNMACHARGQIGEGNVIGHGRTRRRYRCTVCGKTFSPRTGTMFHRRHTALRLIVQVIPLVSCGRPVVAIAAAFGLQARTVRGWGAAASHQSAAVQQPLVQQPRELGQAGLRRRALSGATYCKRPHA
jgi:transposase-like protein